MVFYKNRKLQTNHKVWLCLVGNTLSMIIILILIIVFRDQNSKYFRLGPNEDLIVVSVNINNWSKWSILLMVVGLIRGCEVLVNELASPILGFRIYNPDCKEINDFTKNELNFLGNAMWFVNNFRSILMVIVTISQFDIALISMFISELVSICTVRYLLNEKKFIKKSNLDDLMELNTPLQNDFN
jgi:hypothetical protein